MSYKIIFNCEILAYSFSKFSNKKDFSYVLLEIDEESQDSKASSILDSEFQESKLSDLAYGLKGAWRRKIIELQEEQKKENVSVEFKVNFGKTYEILYQLPAYPLCETIFIRPMKDSEILTFMTYFNKIKSEIISTD